MMHSAASFLFCQKVLLVDCR